MKNNSTNSNPIKIASGLRAGLWITLGAGLGDLQTVQAGSIKPVVASTTNSPLLGQAPKPTAV